MRELRTCGSVGGAGWVTIGSTRQPTAPRAVGAASPSVVARRLSAGVRHYSSSMTESSMRLNDADVQCRKDEGKVIL
jgi:hypothetical protein